jgi:hypothetical protein
MFWMNMFWMKKKNRYAPAGLMYEIRAGRWWRNKCAFRRKRAKTSVNLLIYDSSIVKASFLRGKNRSKLPFFGYSFGFLQGES